MQYLKRSKLNGIGPIEPTMNFFRYFCDNLQQIVRKVFTPNFFEKSERTKVITLRIGPKCVFAIKKTFLTNGKLKCLK